MTIESAGFGGRALIGALMGYLDDVTPEQCYEYIKKDMALFGDVSDSGWARARELAKKPRAGGIIKRDVLIVSLRKHRHDLLGVIINHPNGLAWLDKQIVEAREKLGLEGA